MSVEILHDKFEKIGFLPIAGNLENETKSILLALNFVKSDVKTLPSFFLILDDPFSRWLRIVSSAFVDSNHSNLGFHEDDFFDFFLYNRLCCRDSSILQKRIYQNSKIFNNTNKIYYIKFNLKLGDSLNHFLYDHNISNQINNSLRSSESIETYVKKLTNFLYDDVNLPYLNKVMKYLKEDYDFINSIEFYAR